MMLDVDLLSESHDGSPPPSIHIHSKFPLPLASQNDVIPGALQASTQIHCLRPRQNRRWHVRAQTFCPWGTHGWREGPDSKVFFACVLKFPSFLPSSNASLFSFFLSNGVASDVGGAMLTPESIEPGGESKMIGSVLVYEAESLEEVRKVVESDIYYKSGVVSLPCMTAMCTDCDFVRQWDPEKLVILPFKLAVSSEEGLVAK
jgi:hypothetical protein